MTWVIRGGVKQWVGQRPDDAPLHKVPTLLDTTERVETAVRFIHAAVMYDHRQRRVIWERSQARLCCEVCGCLCLADEVCPGCRAAREEAA